MGLALNYNQVVQACPREKERKRENERERGGERERRLIRRNENERLRFD